ncbi:MAG: TonB family protein [Chromatiales bacterium]|nr:MAG: TonB family protein [Chromatiales bacterium]
MYDIFETIRDFLDRGGQVIVIIAWVIFAMWTMIIERVLYLRTEHRQRVKQAFDELSERPDEGSWSFEAVRSGAISQLGQRLQAGIPMIRTLAAVCPLLGLLGTVTGMIVIFDVMAAMGNSSPRAVAGGVAQATMTTMAGMVGALSGVFPAVLLARVSSHNISTLRTHDAVVEFPPTRLPPLNQAVRLIIALSMAFLITMLLVYGMQRLIETGERALTEETRIYIADFVRIQRDETIERKQVKPEKVATAETAPDSTVIPDIAESDSAGAIGVDFSTGGGQLDTGFTLNVTGVTSFENADADYMPLVKVAPIYPRRAAARGLAGWVLLRFTVTAAGSVKDVEVLESTDPIFERAAVQAALKFKYKPRIVDGEAVEVTGVLHYIRFDVEE